jgi:extradiol dioxygenase family protein
MIRIREIDHLVLRVRDIDAMRRFYSARSTWRGGPSSACRTCASAARWST